MFKAEKDSIIPIPKDLTIKDSEKYFKRKFPKEYVDFIKNNNGCIPITNNFKFPQQILDRYSDENIQRFLYIIDEENLIHEYNDYFLNGEDVAMYDIMVVETNLGSRITPSEYMDSYEYSLVPIALTDYNNYICLDYRQNRRNPSICFWDNEDSEEENPITTTIANSFEEFLNGLHE